MRRRVLTIKMRSAASPVANGTGFALRFVMGKNIVFAAAALLIPATPAFAENGAAVPEASSALLLALGVLGIIIGRRGGKRPKDADAGDSIK